MKRSQPVRKAPLAGQATPLARTTPLAAGTGLTTARGLLRGTAKPRPPRNTGPTVTTRRVVYTRAGECCERCGQPITGQFSVHHRLPRGMGGTKNTAANSPSNLALLCGSATTPGGCHTTVERFRDAAVSTGWIVPRGTDPAATPLKRHNGWFLLNDDGTLTATTRPEVSDAQQG